MYTSLDTNKAKTANVIFLLMVYYSLSTIMPAVAQYISAYLYMGTVVILYLMILSKNYNTFNYYFMFLLPMLPVMILQLLNIYLYGSESIPLFLYGRLLYYIPLVLMYYLISNNKRFLIKTLIIVMLSAYVITAFTTYIGLLTNPDAARILATVDSKDVNAVTWGRLNIGGFETVYSIVILFPMLICLYKKKIIPLLIFIGITTIFIFCILQAQYATALILFFSSLILLFLKKEFNRKKVWYLIVFAVLSYFLFKALLADFMTYLSYNIQSSTLADRFKFIADTLNGIENKSDVGNRIDRYMMSINSFLKSPIIGTFLFNRYGTGGHSFILDTLGQFGLIGGMALFIFFKQIYIKFYLPFRNTQYFGYMVWGFILYIGLSVLNPTGFLIVIGFIVPGIAYLLQDKNYKTGSKGAPYLEDNVGDK